LVRYFRDLPHSLVTSHIRIDANPIPISRTYVGVAMRICIDLGIHRRSTSLVKPNFKEEMRKRIFWSCYCLDRQVSIPIGRPFAISDHDIDTPVRTILPYPSNGS
jgi:Fungal specific transcription factor domain